MKKIFAVIFSILLFLFFSVYSFGQGISYEAGNGIHFKSNDNKFDLLLSGYINTMFAYHNLNQNNSIQNSFSVHRARLDLGFDYSGDYGGFFELETAGQRTAMVLAQVQVRLFDKNYIMAGKYIDPFSPENNRSTSRLTTIERYSGLNSVFLLPGVDTQYGLMFFGMNSNINYFVSITNGNGAAGQNISENNDSKNITGRLDYKLNENVSFGGSASYAKEQPQILSLLDHTFESFSNANIMGGRIGYLAHFEYDNNPVLLRGEIFRYNFREDLSFQNQVKDFTGAYAEAGYFLSGNSEHGFQLIGRFETARYSNVISNFAGPTALDSYIFGTNWFMNNIFSFQVNLIYEKANSVSLIPNSRKTGKDSEFLFLTTLQLRF
ncbi:MAG TPA: porin [Ignavibacteriaceae bacterium]|nr:porin [Ignavibacteriaceae bacterium]